MDNHGNTPDQVANKQIQKAQPRTAKGHNVPDSIMRDADLAQMGGGSSAIHGDQRKPNGFSEPTRISAADMLASQMNLGNTEYMDEMMAEQRENQGRNAMSRHRGGTTNPDDTSDKTA